MKRKFFGLINSVLLLLLFVPSYDGTGMLYEGSRCKTREGKDGTCKLLNNCQKLLLGIHSRDVRPGSYNRCSFVRAEEVVCCEDEISISERTGKRKAEIACDAYKNAGLNYYILKGEATKDGEFPHMAAIALKSELTSEVEYSCGGSLISNRFVLTAAHCVKDILRMPEYVRLGVRRVDDNHNAVDIGIEDIISYPEHVPKYKYNDIALIKLNQTVGLSRFIKPACLHWDPSPVSPDVNLITTGWGETNIHTRARSKDMLKATLKYVDLDECNSTYAENGYHGYEIPQGIIATQLCAFNEDGADSCRGDSGGPLQIVTQGQNGSIIDVIGVVSFASGCGGLPGIYTSVPRYIDWIESIVWPNEL